MTVKKRHFLSQNNRLRAFLPFLFFISFLLPQQTWAQAVENCNNGIDDDGDGLIDCYDQDCTCTGQCDDFYYQTCDANCFYIPPCGQISLGIQWVGQAETGTYSTLVAGDMDKDGIPDIVTYRVEKPDLYIIDGATGATKVHIICPSDFAGGTAPAIADLDHDGYGEIVIVANDRYLRCYEHDGTLKYTSAIQVGYDQRYRFSVPNIADFDHDGWAEVNIGNQVFNGQTGALLAEGGPNVSAGEHPLRKANGFSFNSTVAIDALPDSFCPDCDGLEIVAGNEVLSVNLITGVVAPVVTVAPPYLDGFTSVADIDRDGDLDAVVQSRKNGWNTLYAWDLKTGTVIREFKLLNNWQEGASRVNIADLNGDGKLEFSFVSYPYLYALKNDFTLMWTVGTNDASAITCSSVFDFCGDGSADVIYRGQSFLQIIDGKTGLVSWQDNCTSLTHIENPLVLDVDNDGQTEIVIECGTNGSLDNGTVVAYEAIGTPGIASRKVWNQHGYFNTNINDDLSVPRYQQNPNIVYDSLRLNTFMNQYFNPTFPSPNGAINLTSLSCKGDSLEATLTICNAGDNKLPALTPISIYRGNPQTTAAQWLGALPIGFVLKPDSCKTLTFRFPRIVSDSVFIVLNDNHSKPTPFNLAHDFPVTTIGECTFTDNIVGLKFLYDPALVNLGPDTAICDHTSIMVQAAGNDLVSWKWQDNSTIPTHTISQPGTYFVTATDICGLTQADTVIVTIDSSTVVSIGPDLVMCAGQTVSASESGFDYYKWGPASAVNCPTCASVIAAPPTSGIITLEAGFSNGCKNRDTLFVTVHDTFNIVIDTTICFGRTVAWNGQTIFPDNSRTFPLQTIHGCDSTVQVRVHGTAVGTYNIQVDSSVCLGKKLVYDGFTLDPGDHKVYFKQAITGCDSIIQLNVLPKDTFNISESRVICYGDSTRIHNQIQNTSGIYRQKYTALDGCDSLHTVRLTVLEPIQLAVDAQTACFGEANGSVSVNVTGNAPPFKYKWMPGGSATPTLENIVSGAYTVTVTDANDCTETAGTTVTNYPPIVFTASTDSVQCFGQSNGKINIETSNTSLVFSLDGTNYLQQLVWPDLSADNYNVFAQDMFGCVDTLPLTVSQPPQLTLALPPDITVSLGDSLALDIQSLGLQPVLFKWNNPAYLSCLNCLTPVTKPLTDIAYTLTVTDKNGCTASDSMRIVVERIINVFVPNIFAPSSEGPNRLFSPGFGVAIQRVKLLQVYDRWGSLVHQVTDAAPNDTHQAWDGRVRGKDALPGVYLWRLELELVDGTIVKYQG
ncbi:MAG: FG-GAP-like repeat-containing protein, partial [Bacteroidota bacterium]